MKRNFLTTGMPLILGGVVLFCLSMLMVSVAEADENLTSDTEMESGYARPETGSSETPGPELSNWHYGAYLDVGYALDSNNPENGLWRSKSTTFKLGEPKVNMAMGYVRKETSPQSRWGMAFGLQAGVDVDGLVPAPPPAANEPVADADLYRHFSDANLSYLVPLGNGLNVTGGLIKGYPAYESYHAIENPNYTRGYLTDFVPYFLVGARAAYPVSDSLDLNFFVVTGYNYLANPNDQPSYGLQLVLEASSDITFTQNLYYGPDQKDTALEFWRFFSDSILEWKRGPFLLAASFDVGTETQADQVGTPQNNWMSGALWAGWQFGEPWSVALRPEFYWDPDGLLTGSIQFIQAYTATLKYEFSPFPFNTMQATLEYRFDNSTGSEGGFYEGPDNRLVPDQHLVLIAFMWSFGK